MLVRFIGAALLGWTAVEIALYVTVSRHYNRPLEIVPCMLKSIPAVIGLVILVKAKAIAEWISNKLDE